MTALDNVAVAIKVFETSVLNWVASEEKVLDSIATELVQAVSKIVTNLKPSVVADIRAILVALPAEFLSGADFNDIAEEVYIQAKGDLKTILQTAKPQLVEAVIGVLVNALIKA